jgi:predicted porin
MLESGYSLANGERTYGGRMFGREAWVGLKSPAWGQLTFGRQTTAGYAWLADAAVPFGNNFTQAASTGAFSTSDFRYDNQIRYLSPEFGGWQAMVGYSFNADGNARFDANGTGQPNVRAWTSGVRYLNGPLTAVLTYDRITNARNTAYAALGEEGVAVSSWNAGFSYDFGVVKLHLGAGLTENGWFATPSQLMNAETGIGEIAIFNEGFRAYSYAVGAGIPAGAHGSVLAGWTMVDPSREGAAYAGTGLRPQHIFSLAYTYGLSPRTALYAIGTVGRNLSLTDGNRTRSLGAGLRHMF